MSSTRTSGSYVQKAGDIDRQAGASSGASPRQSGSPKGLPAQWAKRTPRTRALVASMASEESSGHSGQVLEAQGAELHQVQQQTDQHAASSSAQAPERSELEAQPLLGTAKPPDSSAGAPASSNGTGTSSSSGILSSPFASVASPFDDDDSTESEGAADDAFLQDDDGASSSSERTISDSDSEMYAPTNGRDNSGADLRASGLSMRTAWQQASGTDPEAAVDGRPHRRRSSQGGGGGSSKLWQDSIAEDGREGSPWVDTPDSTPEPRGLQRWLSAIQLLPEELEASGILADMIAAQRPGSEDGGAAGGGGAAAAGQLEARASSDSSILAAEAFGGSSKHHAGQAPPARPDLYRRASSRQLQHPATIPEQEGLESPEDHPRQDPAPLDGLEDSGEWVGIRSSNGAAAAPPVLTASSQLYAPLPHGASYLQQQWRPYPQQQQPLPPQPGSFTHLLQELDDLPSAQEAPEAAMPPPPPRPSSAHSSHAPPPKQTPFASTTPPPMPWLQGPAHQQQQEAGQTQGGGSEAGPVEPSWPPSLGRAGSMRLGRASFSSGQESNWTGSGAVNVLVKQVSNMSVDAEELRNLIVGLDSAAIQPRVGLVYDTIMEQHMGPPDHFERPARTAVLVEVLERRGLTAQCHRLPAKSARDEDLLRAHTAEHIAAVDAGYQAGSTFQLTVDNYFCAGTAPAARMAAGCCVQAVEAVMSGEVGTALAVVRPPGHHAECNRAQGFCFFNNVVVAALRARAMGAQRVLILDWDAHHGNGIQHILEEDPAVMYISIHRGNGFYPGTGEACETGRGLGAGFTLNIPWPRGGFGDADYIATFDLVIEPVLRAFDPEIVIVAAGFDAAEGDPLGQMFLSPACYAHMTSRLMRFGKGRFVAALEGGYNVAVTAECAAACVSVMLGAEPPELLGRGARKPLRDTGSVLQTVAQAHAPFWKDMAAVAARHMWKRMWTEYVSQLRASAPTAGRRMLGKHMSIKESHSYKLEESMGRGLASAAQADVPVRKSGRRKATVPWTEV